MSPAATFDATIGQVKEALRTYQAGAAVAQLTALLATSLTPAQQALAHAQLAHAYEQQSQWADLQTLLQPYEDFDRRKSLPTPTQYLLCLRLAALRTETGAFTSALHFAERALYLAAMANHGRDQGAAHQALGKIYRLLGQPAFARDHYQAALTLHRQVGDGRLLASSHFGLGVVAAGTGDYETAYRSLDCALRFVGLAEDPLLYGHLCGLRAATMTLEETQPCAERLTWFRHAEAAFTKIGQRKYLARTLNNWGDQLLLVGQWQEAQALLQRAFTLGQEVNDQRTLATVMESLGTLHALQGDFDTGQSYLAEALLRIKEKDRFVEAQTLLAMAQVLHWQGDEEAARATLKRLLPLAAQAEAKRLTGAARLLQAEIACEQQELALVEPLLIELGPEIKALKSLGLWGQWHFIRGRLAFWQQQDEQARTLLEQARSAFAVSARRLWLGRTAFALAELYEQQGDRKAASTTMRQAQQQFQTLAAQPFWHQTKAWLQQHPARQAPLASPAATKRAAATKQEAITLSPAQNSDLLRLLEAAHARPVLLRELVTLLQRELPPTEITITELTATGKKRLFPAPDEAKLRPARARSASSYVQRLEPSQGAALELSLCPAPPSVAGLQHLFATAEYGLELCARRAKETRLTDYEWLDERVELPLPGMLYQSPVIRALAVRIHKIQGSEVPVLITGESGTGKELVARAIHALSARRQQRFIAFNCASASPELIDDQLFGHRRGAFTGATEPARGWIRAAAGGTLFLDEIAELPPTLQPKLLRFLQAGEIQPLGEDHPLQVDVRIIAATNRPLQQLVEAGQFRADLFYRLKVISLHVPPLTARREEISLLARHFLAHYARQMRKTPLQLAPETLDVMTAYDWPGNVRQLENEIQQMVAYAARGAMLSPAQLSVEVQAANSPPAEDRDEEQTLQARVAHLERTLIAQALERFHGNVSRAAEALGLARKTLYGKLERYQISFPA
jgi:DNA-binding NtrC family response regulator/tetratricopeptide (TPR) repeat protein